MKLFYYITGTESRPFYSPYARKRVISIGMFQLMISLFSSLAYYVASIQERGFLTIYLSLLIGLMVIFLTKLIIVLWPYYKLKALALAILFGSIIGWFANIAVWGNDKIEQSAEMLKDDYANQKLQEWKQTKNYKTLKKETLDQLRIKNIDENISMDADSVMKIANQILEVEEKKILNKEKENYKKQSFKKLRGLISYVSSSLGKTLISVILLVNIIVFLVGPALLYSQLAEYWKEVQNEKKKSLQNQISIFSSIQHELGNKLPALRNDISDLKGYFIEDKTNSSVMGLSQKIRNPLPGEELNEIDTIGDVLNRIESKLNYSINIVDNASGIINSDPSRYKPERISLLKFLKEETNKHITGQKNLNFEYQGDESLKVNLDGKQFSIVIHNLINNAIRHGFTDPKKSYTILFQVYEERNQVILSVKNNGNPFPTNFTQEKYTQPFSYSGSTGNTGLGGYIINNILQNHNAKLDIKNVIDGDYVVQIDIKFEK